MQLAEACSASAGMAGGQAPSSCGTSSAKRRRLDANLAAVAAGDGGAGSCMRGWTPPGHPGRCRDLHDEVARRELPAMAFSHAKRLQEVF